MCFLLLVISDSALLPFSATGGGRKATNQHEMNKLSLIHIFMSPTALMMIHNPLTVAIGDSEEMQTAIRCV